MANSYNTNRYCAIYSTCYPSVVKYLPKWLESVLAQSDQKYVLCIGMDGVEEEVVTRYLDPNIAIRFIHANAGDTPASLRSKAFGILTEEFSELILTDMDDLLLPSRVEAARTQLESVGMSCCAMQILRNDVILSKPVLDPIGTTEELLSTNVFGLSNTAWRSSLLRSCLPIPAKCTLVDWLIATRAIGRGERVYRDSTQRMIYRVHADSMATIIPPFSEDYLIRATKLVLEHYEILLDDVKHGIDLPFSGIEQRHSYCKFFLESMVTNSRVRAEYTKTINNINIAPKWWSCVAHPDLEHIWKA